MKKNRFTDETKFIIPNKLIGRYTLIEQVVYKKIDYIIKVFLTIWFQLFYNVKIVPMLKNNK